MNEQKKTSPLQWVMYGEMLILAALLLLAIVLENYDLSAPKDTQPSQSESTEATDYIAPTEQFITDLSNPSRIVTPYGTLAYPEGYEEYLRAELVEDSYGIQYSADFGEGKVQNLFAIRFGGSGENLAGYANGTAVYLVVASVAGDWSEEQLRFICTMQEEVNVLLQGIINDAPQNPEEFLPTDDGKSLKVQTPYGNLLFPSRWQDHLRLTVNDEGTYSVTFSCKTENHGNVALFTVYFGGEEGIEAGVMRDAQGNVTTVRITIYPFDPDNSWTYQEKTTVVSMLEDVNYLIQNLESR